VVFTCGLRGLCCSMSRSPAPGRPALRPAWRRAAQPDPGAVRASAPRCTPRTAASMSRASMTTCSTSSPGSANSSAGSAPTREVPRVSRYRHFHTPPGFSPFEAVRFQPTLEFNGIGGGYQGEGTKTVIPSKAFVKISCRLVPNQEPAKIKRAADRTIRERVPADVKVRIVDQHEGDPLRRGAARPVEHPEGPVARARARLPRRRQGGGGGLRPPARSICARAAACRSSPTSSVPGSIRHDGTLPAGR
jgi:hypothetical protein